MRLSRDRIIARLNVRDREKAERAIADLIASPLARVLPGRPTGFLSTTRWPMKSLGVVRF